MMGIGLAHLNLWNVASCNDATKHFNTARYNRGDCYRADVLVRDRSNRVKDLTTSAPHAHFTASLLCGSSHHRKQLRICQNFS
jgi:hypothetical protein